MTGREFEAWRKRLDWTQEQAAAALGQSRRWVQETENRYQVHPVLDLLTHLLEFSDQYGPRSLIDPLWELAEQMRRQVGRPRK